MYRVLIVRMIVGIVVALLVCMSVCFAKIDDDLKRRRRRRKKEKGEGGMNEQRMTMRSSEALYLSFSLLSPPLVYVCGWVNECVRIQDRIWNVD